ncbi:isopenicillin N synthase family dioxygenase [Spongisporangium articulatum]|uniref:Isopenicillin N synthase family dioxygenase n=1 Tax=Spongisporangium articulatum TaxID=3362603 RepID=A0ABW8AQX2_9ACTN
MPATVPLIDLTGWYSGDEAARAGVVAAVDRALSEIGFLLVTGHRVPAEVLRGLRAAGKAFFRADDDAKRPYAAPVGVRGWSPPGNESHAGATGVEAPPDLKEVYRFGATFEPPVPGHDEWYGPNVWPAEVPEFERYGEAFAAAARELSDDLLEIFALAAGLEPGFFTERSACPPYSVVVNWYPSLAAVGEPAEGQFRIGQHTDFGSLTVLDREPGYGGLQVQTLDGEWIDAPYVPGALTVNTGDLLARWSGDRWRSTMHRVLPPDPRDADEELVSLVFFHEADPWTVVETLPSELAGPTVYPPVGAGDFLKERLASITV